MSATRLVERDGIDPGREAPSALDDLVRLARYLLDRGDHVVGPDLFAEATRRFPGLAGLVPGVGRFDPCDWAPRLTPRRQAPHWMGERRSPSAFGHSGASGSYAFDPDAGLAAAAVTDAPSTTTRLGRSTGRTDPTACPGPGPDGGLVASDRADGRARGAGVRIGVVTFRGRVTSGHPCRRGLDGRRAGGPGARRR